MHVLTCSSFGSADTLFNSSNRASWCSTQQRLQQYKQRRSSPVQVSAQTSEVAQLSEGLELPVQLLYLISLLGFLVVGAYLVVRQVCQLHLSLYSGFLRLQVQLSCCLHSIA